MRNTWAGIPAPVFLIGQSFVSKQAGTCSHVMHFPCSDERRLWPDCLVVKSNHPCLERLGFEQLQLRRVLDVLKERDSTT